MKRSFRVPGGPCPACGENLNGAADVDKGNPRAARPGDFSICAYCFVYLVFTKTLGLRTMSDGEWLALPVDMREHLTGLRELLKSRDK